MLISEIKIEKISRAHPVNKVNAYSALSLPKQKPILNPNSSVGYFCMSTYDPVG